MYAHLDHDTQPDHIIERVENMILGDWIADFNNAGKMIDWIGPGDTRWSFCETGLLMHYSAYTKM